MSPEVTVRFTGELRALAGLGSLQLSLKEGATLGDAVAVVGELVSPAFTNQLAFGCQTLNSESKRPSNK